MKTKINIVFFFFFIIISNAQSPWVREKGKSYVQIGLSSINFNQQTNNNGDVVSIGADFTDVTLQVYAEYGLTKNLEVQAILPYKFLSIENSLGKNSYSNIGNASLGLKYLILDDNIKLTSGVLYTPRTGSYSEKTGLSTGFNAQTVLPYVSVGMSQEKLYGYLKVGYGYLSNKYSDYLNTTLEIGYNIIKNGHIILVLDEKKIIKEEAAYNNDIQSRSYSYPDRQEYTAVGLKTNYEFTKDKLGANLSVFGAFGAKNTPYAPSINLGIYTKF